MPVNEKQTQGEVLYQREIYCRGGISRIYWDYKDSRLLAYIAPADQFILDLGCGEGILLEKIVRRCPEKKVLGIDVMQENIKICKTNALPVEYGDLYNLTLTDNSVDTVFLIEVIEHLTQPQRALQEIHRILKPGGKVVILFPNDSVFAVARFVTLKFKEWKYNPGHVRQWTHNDLQDVLREIGFLPKLQRSIPFFFWPISLHGMVVAEKYLPER